MNEDVSETLRRFFEAYDEAEARQMAAEPGTADLEDAEKALDAISDAADYVLTEKERYIFFGGLA